MRKRQYLFMLMVPLTHVLLLSPGFLEPNVISWFLENFSASHPPWRAIPLGMCGITMARFQETRLDPQILVGCLPVKLEVDNALSWLGRIICSWGIFTVTSSFVEGEWEECLWTPVWSLQVIDIGGFLGGPSIMIGFWGHPPGIGATTARIEQHLIESTERYTPRWSNHYRAVTKTW